LPKEGRKCVSRKKLVKKLANIRIYAYLCGIVLNYLYHLNHLIKLKAKQ